MRGKTYSYLNDSIDEDENKNKLFRKKQNRCESLKEYHKEFTKNNKLILKKTKI